MRCYGSVVTFRLKGELVSEELLAMFRVFTIGKCKGGVQSMATLLKTRSKDGHETVYIFLSIGLESLDDLIEDLANALELTRASFS